MMHTYQTNMEMKKVSPITTIKDYFSENTFNMHMTVPVHFCSINRCWNNNQESPLYIGRQH